jgi:hypothetical protein
MTAAIAPIRIEPLPDAALPQRSSSELVTAFIERAIERGVPRKTIALRSGLEPNYVSMLKKGEPLPLARILPLAVGCGLSAQECFELLTARIVELHGLKVELDAEALATWVEELSALSVSEAVLPHIWREKSAAAPAHLHGLLERPDVAERVRAVLHQVAQEEMHAMAQA